MKTYVAVRKLGAGEELVLLEHLDALGEEATPEALLERARPVASALHRLFEWDNAVAGERYRLEQAALYIRHVEYVPARGREPLLIEMPRPLRPYVRPEMLSLTGIDATMRTIERLQAELEDVRRRYSACAELRPVLEGPLDQAVRDLTRVALSLGIPVTDEERAEGLLPAWAA